VGRQELATPAATKTISRLAIRDALLGRIRFTQSIRNLRTTCFLLPR
jgi:hypothetical protein